MIQLSLFKVNQSLHLDFVAILILSLLAPTPLSAQNTQKKTESDGFVWYKTYIDHGYEIKDVNGQIIIPHTRGYNPVDYRKKMFEVGRGYDKKGLCDLSGKELISPDRGYYSLMIYDDYIQVTKIDENKKFRKGVCDLSGKELISPDRGYDDVSMYGTEWYRVTRNNKMGACNLSGKEIISPDRNYDLVTVYRGWVGVKRNGKEGVCDLSGKEILSPDRGYDEAILWDEIIQVKVNDKFGVCDLTGKEIIHPMYNSISKEDGALLYKDANGEWQPIPVSSYTSPSYAAMFNRAAGTSADKNQVHRKKIVENNGYVWYLLYQGPYQGAEDANGKTLIPLSLGYTIVNTKYHQGKWHFRGVKNNNTGYYDENGNEMISPDRGYQTVYLSKTHFYVTRNEKQGICDLSGYEIISPDRGYDEVAVLGNYIQVIKNKKYGACDFAGNEVVAPIYDYILLVDGVFKYKGTGGKYYPVPANGGSNDSASSSSSPNASSNRSTNSSFSLQEYHNASWARQNQNFNKSSNKAQTSRSSNSYNNRKTTNTTNSQTSYSSRNTNTSSSYNSRTSRATHSSRESASNRYDNSQGSDDKKTKTIERKKCFHCSGSGKVKCNTCRGDGRLKCGACKGTGYWTQKGVRHDCAACDRGFTRCNSCGGKGTRKCGSCYGKGYN